MNAAKKQTEVRWSEQFLISMLVPRYFRWNRKSDLKDWGRDGESNRAFPLTPPSPSGRGRTCERFVSVRGMLASIPRIEARQPRRLDQHLHNRTPSRTQLFQTSRVVLLLPQGEGWAEEEGSTLSFTARFSAVGSGLNSTENSEKPQRDPPGVSAAST